MPRKKHDWNNLDNYLDVHNNVLRTYSKYFTNVPSYHQAMPTAQMLELRAVIHLGHLNLKIEIEKVVEVDRPGKKLVGRTFSYSYNVADAIGSYFRYCSPRAHRPYHHKHVYNRTTRIELRNSPMQIGEDDYPHVNEVIDEALSL